MSELKFDTCSAFRYNGTPLIPYLTSYGDRVCIDDTLELHKQGHSEILRVVEKLQNLASESEQNLETYIQSELENLEEFELFPMEFFTIHGNQLKMNYVVPPNTIYFKYKFNSGRNYLVGQLVFVDNSSVLFYAGDTIYKTVKKKTTPSDELDD